MSTAIHVLSYPESFVLSFERMHTYISRTGYNAMGLRQDSLKNRMSSASSALVSELLFDGCGFHSDTQKAHSDFTSLVPQLPEKNFATTATSETFGTVRVRLVEGAYLTRMHLTRLHTSSVYFPFEDTQLESSFQNNVPISLSWI